MNGDTVVLTLEVTEDAYIWVFDTGTSGKVHQIFPNRFEDNNFLRAGQPVVIPSADADYQFSVAHPAGTELLTVIASEDSVPPAQDLIDLGAEAGPYLALLGTSVSIAKDLAVALKKKKNWAKQDIVLYVQ